MNLGFRTVDISLSVIVVFHLVNSKETGASKKEDTDSTKPKFEHGNIRSRLYLELISTGIVFLIDATSKFKIYFVLVYCHIFKKEVTISGSSTGSTFAQSLHLSYSKMFSGSGHFSGCKQY